MLNIELLSSKNIRPCRNQEKDKIHLRSDHGPGTEAGSGFEKKSQENQETKNVKTGQAFLLTGALAEETQVPLELRHRTANRKIFG